MNLNIEGQRINGLYLGFLPYSGLVVDSRVKYGGDIQYTVLIDEPIKVYGEVRDIILVCKGEVNRILVEEMQ
jgi:hypothetical protein